MACRILGTNEKRLNRIEGIQGRGNPNKTTISESGLYKLIMRAPRSTSYLNEECLSGPRGTLQNRQESL